MRSRKRSGAVVKESLTTESPRTSHKKSPTALSQVVGLFVVWWCLVGRGLILPTLNHRVKWIRDWQICLKISDPLVIYPNGVPVTTIGVFGRCVYFYLSARCGLL